jgi:hypothetical protein
MQADKNSDDEREKSIAFVEKAILDLEHFMAEHGIKDEEESCESTAKPKPTREGRLFFSLNGRRHLFRWRK